MQGRDGFGINDFAARNHPQRLVERYAIDINDLVVIEFTLSSREVASEKERDPLVAKAWNGNDRP